MLHRISIIRNIGLKRKRKKRRPELNLEEETTGRVRAVSLD